MKAAELCGDGLAPFGMSDAGHSCPRPTSNTRRRGARGLAAQPDRRLWLRSGGVVEDGMSDDTAALILTLAVEISELRAQLGEAQDLLVETAVDAGEMHARLEEVQAELIEARAERDAWRVEAERGRRAG